MGPQQPWKAVVRNLKRNIVQFISGFAQTSRWMCVICSGAHMLWIKLGHDEMLLVIIWTTIFLGVGYSK